MNKELIKAIEVLKQGGIVIFPTDTAFGIGCRIDDKKAIDTLFRIRKRPRSQAMPILVSSENMALPYLTTQSDIVRHFMHSYWPGGLTIVAPIQKNLLYSPICGGGANAGFRMPNHSDLITIIDAVGVPIVGPSANIHGGPTPFFHKDLDPHLVSRVDFVMKGECGGKVVSTVVDCSTFPYTVIRDGAIRLIDLYVDAREQNAITVRLTDGKEMYEKRVESMSRGKELVLPILESLLLEANLSLSDVTTLSYHVGPGSYTGLRVGASIVRTLGKLMNIPVNGHKAEEKMTLMYENDRWNV